MAGVFQEKKQTILIIVLTVVIIATALVFYYGFYNPPTDSIGFEQFESESAEEVINKIEFDVDFFKESRFQALKTYGQWPIGEITGTGRSNPFLSFVEKKEEAEEEETEEEPIEEDLIEEESTSTDEIIEDEIPEEESTSTDGVIE